MLLLRYGLQKQRARFFVKKLAEKKRETQGNGILGLFRDFNRGYPVSVFVNVMEGVLWGSKKGAWTSMKIYLLGKGYVSKDLDLSIIKIIR